MGERWLSKRRWPPGYAAASRRVDSAVVLEIVLATTGWLLGADQLLIVQPNLYRQTGIGPSEGVTQGCLLVTLAIGWLTALGLRAANRQMATEHASKALLLVSMLLAASAFAHEAAFARGVTASWLSCMPSLGGAFLLGRSLRRVPMAWSQRVPTDELARNLLQPLVTVGAIGLLIMSAVASSALGSLRACLAVSGILAAAAALGQSLTSDSHPRTARVTAVSCAYSLLCVYAGLAIFAEQTLPLRVVLESSLPVVHFARNDRCSLTVTQGQGAYHLFVDGELRFSTTDQHRWAEALARSAMARAANPQRALVLSTGEGLIERELLSDPGVLSITSVVRCQLAADFARRSGWLRHLTKDSMQSKRVTLIERDPAAFVATLGQTTYDLVIVDLPDPANAILSKYYSRYFYQRLAAVMDSRSLLVVQATSARRSPRTFATIGSTLRSAGLFVQPQMVPLISRGEWSLYLAGIDAIPHVVRPKWIEHSLAHMIESEFNRPWPDTLPPEGFHAEPSTLNDAKVLDWFEFESAQTSQR